MNLYQYLHWDSNHSRKIYFAIIKGEIIRYLRICSRRVDFEVMKKLFSERLKRRGFPVNVVRDAFRKSPDYTKRFYFLNHTSKKNNNVPQIRFFKEFEQNFDYDDSLECILKRHWKKSPRDVRSLKPPKIINKSKRNLHRRFFR